MKKIAIQIIFTLLSMQSFAQNKTYDKLIEQAQVEFVKETGVDYSYVVNLMEEAVKIKPDDPLSRYMLGSAYSYLNSLNDKTIPQSVMGLTIKSSEQFEKVNALTPQYQGSIINLDPYSKISSLWGTLALSYYCKNKIDSARWAFNEGKRRGGFGDFMLSVYRKQLDLLHPNSIILTTGDNDLYSVMYLQAVENYRPDVAVISISLLETVWYPTLSKEMYGVDFGYSSEQLDTLNYKTLDERTIKLSTSTPSGELLEWSFSTDRGVLLRSDRLLLGLVQNNRFERDIYCGRGHDTALSIGLFDIPNNKKHIENLILVQRINYDNSLIDVEECKATIKDISEYIKCVNQNSIDEVNVLKMIISQFIDQTYTITKDSGESDSELLKSQEILWEMFEQSVLVVVPPQIKTQFSDYLFEKILSIQTYFKDASSTSSDENVDLSEMYDPYMQLLPGFTEPVILRNGQKLPYSKLRQILGSIIMIPQSVEESGVAQVVVKLEFSINNKGRVDDITVGEPTDPELANAAISAIVDMQFKPATKNGNPIGMRVKVPIMFRF